MHTLYCSFFSQYSLWNEDVMLCQNYRQEARDHKFKDRIFKQSLEMSKILLIATRFKYIVYVASSEKSQFIWYIPSHTKLVAKPGNKHIHIYSHKVTTNT